MTAFPNLSDDEIASVLGYIDGVYKGTYGAAPGAEAVAAVGGEKEESGLSTPFFIVLFLILGILAVALARIISNLNRNSMTSQQSLTTQLPVIPCESLFFYVH